MLLEPNVIVFYVENVAISSHFYQDLLGIKPREDSTTFHAFELSNGMHLALKARDTIVPPVENSQCHGHGELAFVLENKQQVDKLCAEWQAKEIDMIFLPNPVPFGYAFVAVDPDGNRLRAVSLGKES